MSEQSAFLESAKRLKNSVVAGTDDITDAASIDMANYEGVKFYIAFGAITSGAVTGVKVQQSSDDGVVDAFADVKGSGVAVGDTDDNKVVVIDVYRPQERYLKPIVTRGTANAVLDGIVAVRYSPRLKPTSDDVTVAARKLLVSPDEGTA